MEKFKVRVIERVQETPTVHLLRLQRTDDKPLEFVAGQWVLTRVQRDGNDIRRAYSIASPPYIKDSFELCIKRVDGGEMSPTLTSMEKGEIFDCAGPYGKFVLVDPLETNIYFVATGTGIAPFRSMIDTLFHRKTDRNIHLYFGVRNEEQIIYGDHFTRLAKEHRNLDYVVTLSRPQPSWKGEKGYVQSLVEKNVNGYNGEEVYICGIPEMVDEVRQMFLNMGCPKERSHVEKWY